jgi:hypothetical protein
MSSWFAKIFGPPPPAAVNRIIRGCAVDIDMKPGNTFYLPPGYSGTDRLASKNMELLGTTPAFSDMTVFKLEMFLNLTSLAATTCTLRKNGADTLATVTIPAGSTYGSITLGSTIGIVSTDLWTIRIDAPALDVSRRNVFCNLHAEIV